MHVSRCARPLSGTRWDSLSSPNVAKATIVAPNRGPGSTSPARRSRSSPGGSPSWSVDRAAGRETDERRHRGADAFDRLRPGGDRFAVRRASTLQSCAAAIGGDRAHGDRESDELHRSPHFCSASRRPGKSATSPCASGGPFEIGTRPRPSWPRRSAPAQSSSPRAQPSSARSDCVLAVRAIPPT